MKSGAVWWGSVAARGGVRFGDAVPLEMMVASPYSRPLAQEGVRGQAGVLGALPGTRDGANPL